MKKILPITAFAAVLLLAVPTAYGQGCSKVALFTKGAELEYHSFMPRPRALFSKKTRFFETTRLVYVVDNVADSLGNTYSYITKTGISSEREKNRYEKKYVLRCQEGKVYLPLDFYSIDTVFLADAYNGLKKRMYYAVSNLKQPETGMQYFSADPAKNEFDFTVKSYASEIKLQYFGMGEYYGMSNITPDKPGAMSHYESSGSLTKQEMETITNIRKNTLKGKENTEASDKPYKAIKAELLMETEIVAHKKGKGPEPNMTGTRASQTVTIYYNEELGIIKTQGDETNPGSYIELFKVTMP